MVNGFILLRNVAKRYRLLKQYQCNIMHTRLSEITQLTNDSAGLGEDCPPFGNHRIIAIQ